MAKTSTKVSKSRKKERVDRRCSLLELRLTESTLTLGQEMRVNELPGTINVNITVGHLSEESLSQLAARIAFTLTARYAPSEAAIISIQATYVLVYKVEPLVGLSDPEKTEFAQKTGLFHCWPFWREYVHSSTTRMGLPAMRMPLLVPQQLTFKNESPQTKP
ncbi:MAG: hypothetical protein WD894_18750 [Pirellulales bacterium]